MSCILSAAIRESMKLHPATPITAFAEKRTADDNHN